MINLIILSILALFITGFSFYSKIKLYSLIAAALWIALGFAAIDYTAILIFSIGISLYLFYDTFIGAL